MNKYGTITVSSTVSVMCLWMYPQPCSVHSRSIRIGKTQGNYTELTRERALPSCCERNTLPVTNGIATSFTQIHSNCYV